MAIKIAEIVLTKDQTKTYTRTTVDLYMKTKSGREIKIPKYSILTNFDFRKNLSDDELQQLEEAGKIQRKIKTPKGEITSYIFSNTQRDILFHPESSSSDE